MFGNSKNKSAKYWVSAGLVLLIGLIWLQKVFLNWKTERKLAQWEAEQERIEQEQRTRYQRLLDQQQAEAEQRQAEQAQRIEAEFSKKDIALLGDHQLHIILVKPPHLTASHLNSLLSELKSGQDYKSFAYIDRFLQQELDKFSDEKLNLKVKPTRQVYNLSDLSAVGDMTNVWGKDPFGLTKLEDQFDQLLDRVKEIDSLDSQTKAVFLYFDDQLVQADSGLFYDKKKFRSFAEEEKKRAYVNVYSFNPSHASTLIETIVHEYLHLYGATDKYKEDEYACLPEGRGNIDLPVVAQQTTADIMCGLIETGPDDFERGGLTQENITVNRYTAEEIGWR
jgi:hypothetical protein